MRVHYLQHVPFERLGSISTWMAEQNHSLSSTRLYANNSLPTVSDFDWLIVLGGSMNIYEEEQYPWLIAEKQLIKQAIEEDKIVLGICLGAQLIADVLGSKCMRGNTRKSDGFRSKQQKQFSNPMPLSFYPLN